jgi:hypothetical protein
VGVTNRSHWNRSPTPNMTTPNQSHAVIPAPGADCTSSAQRSIEARLRLAAAIFPLRSRRARARHFCGVGTALFFQITARILRRFWGPLERGTPLAARRWNFDPGESSLRP